jgi:hypothetical protein
MWEGFSTNVSSPESLFASHDQKPTRGILKGGAYGSQEKGQEESQKEKTITFLDEGLWW